MGSKEILPAMTLTLEESTTERVPQLLEEILKRVTPQFITDSIQKDYLFIVIIVSMIENGFVLVDSDCHVIDHNLIDTKQLSEWKSQSGVCEALFILYGFKNISLKLIMSPLITTTRRHRDAAAPPPPALPRGALHYPTLLFPDTCLLPVVFIIYFIK